MVCSFCLLNISYSLKVDLIRRQNWQPTASAVFILSTVKQKPTEESESYRNFRRIFLMATIVQTNHHIFVHAMDICETLVTMRQYNGNKIFIYVKAFIVQLVLDASSFFNSIASLGDGIYFKGGFRRKNAKTTFMERKCPSFSNVLLAHAHVDKSRCRAEKNRTQIFARKVCPLKYIQPPI